MNKPPDIELVEPADLAYFQRLERRDWELWSIALLLMVVFAGGMLAHVYSAEAAQMLSPGASRMIWVALLGLVVLVALLNYYLIDRKRALGRLWRRYLLQSEQLQKEREQGLIDPLTRVYNRRSFDEMIPRTALRCVRNGHSLTFVLLDLPDLKWLNDRLGHMGADEVLQHVAALLKETLRLSDLTFRFGGSEFLLALPDTDADDSLIVEGRLKERIAKQKEILELVGQPLRVLTSHSTYSELEKLHTVIEKAEDAVQALREGIEPH